MVSTESIHDWSATLRRHLPLSRPQAKGLATWSMGVVASGSCGQTVVSYTLAQALGQKPDTVRQRLRAFCYEASARRDRKRRALDAKGCFAGLLGWVQSLWHGDRMALALDATSLKQDFVVLSVSVVFRGTAVPVAWQVLKGATPGAWAAHWLELLERLRGMLSPDLLVLVPADRGLYAPWLFEAIVSLGWHPFLRLNDGGYFTPDGQERRPLKACCPQPGTSYGAHGVAFQENPITGTLLAHWEPGYKDPWRVLTDLAPEDARIQWYAVRAWIEQGFKALKGGGFRWDRTRMRDPERVNRFWLVLAVTTLWLVAVGGAAEDRQAPRAAPAAAPSAVHAPPRRRLSVFRRGWVCVRGWLMGDAPRPPVMRLRPEPWPTTFGAHEGQRQSPTPSVPASLPLPSGKLLRDPPKTTP